APGGPHTVRHVLDSAPAPAGQPAGRLAHDGATVHAADRSLVRPRRGAGGRRRGRGARSLPRGGHEPGQVPPRAGGRLLPRLAPWHHPEHAPGAFPPPPPPPPAPPPPP